MTGQYDILFPKKQKEDPYSSLFGPPSGGSLAIDDDDGNLEEEENPFFLKKAWNFAKFMTEPEVFESVVDLVHNPVGYVRRMKGKGDLGVFAEGAKRSLDDVKDVIYNRGIGSWFSDTAKESLNAVGEIVTNPIAGVNQFANGLIDFFAETPLEAITGQRNVNGNAVPMTPEEHVQAVQQTIANAGNYLIQRGITRKILNVPQGHKVMNATKMGNLGKVIASNAVGGAVSSAVTEPLAQLGQEDYLSKVVMNTLVSASAGTILGAAFDYRGYNSAIAEGKVEFRAAQDNLANQLAAAAFLHNNPTKTPIEIAASVEAVLGSDDLVEAAVRSGLHGRGFVVPKLSVEEGNALLEKIAAAPEGSKEYTLPPKYAAKFRPRFSGIPIEWESQFDMIAYMAQANGFAKHPDLMADVMAKTGINRTQLIAHGKAVKQTLKGMANDGLFSELTQQDIDFLETGYASRGRDVVTAARDGETLRDFNGKDWTKDGDVLLSGHERIPVNSSTTFLQFGRDPMKAGAVGNKKLTLAKLDFQGNYNRNVETVSIAHGPNGEAYISSSPLSETAREMFESTGFLPMQGVTVKGSQYQWFVDGFTPLKRNALDRIKSVKYDNPEKALETLMDVRKEFDEAPGSGKLVIRRYDPTAGWITKTQPVTDISLSLENRVRSTILFEGQRKSVISGAVTPNKYAGEFVSQVVSSYRSEVLAKLDKNIELPTFEDIYLKVGQELGLKQEQTIQLREAIYQKIGDELLSRVLDEDEVFTFKKLRKEIEDLSVEEETDHAGFFRQLIERNGYYATDVNGKLEIRDLQTNDVVSVVSNLREGINFMAQSGKMPLPTYDGVIPSDFMKLGNLATDVKVVDTKWSRALDIINTNTHAINFVPIRNLWASVTNNLERLGVKNTIFHNVEKINDSLMKRRMFFAENETLLESYRKIVQSADGLKADQLDHVGRIMQTMSRDEIINSYLSRAMNPDEIQVAQSFAKELGNLNETTEAINNAYLAGVKMGKVGSVDFKQGVSHLLAQKQIKPQVASLVLKLADKIASSSPDAFSPHAVLKLANALQFPSAAKSFADYAKTSGMTPQAIDIAVKLKSLFEDAAIRAGIPEARQIGAYLPQIKQVDTFDSFTQTKIPEDFARELNRVLSDRQDIISNPLVLAYTYIQSMANAYAGTGKILNQLEKEISDPEKGVTKRLLDYDAEQKKLNPSEKSEVGRTQAAALAKLQERYREAIMGYPDISDQARKAMRAMANKMLGLDLKGSFNSGSMIALIDSAYVGARPIQAVRDIITSMGVTYQLFGAKFLKGALFDEFTFSKKELDILESDLKIPRVTSQDFLAPDTDYASGAAMGEKKTTIAKLQDIGMTLSGQHAVYVRTLAGIYKHTSKLVYETLGQAKRQEITLEQAIDKLQLEVHNPAVQREFLAYARAGDIDGAARFLGKWNGKIIANNYGEMQSPLTWRKGVGKMLGQFGSWGANMMQTQMDYTRGFGGPNWKKSAKRAARLGMFTAGLMAVGNTYDLDLKNVMFTPVQAMPGVGPLAQLYLDIAEAGNLLFSTDGKMVLKGVDTIGRYTVPGYPKWTEVGKFYIPGSYQLRDLLRATEAWNNGSDPFFIASQALGLPIQKEP